MIGHLLPPPDVGRYEVPVYQLAMRKVAAMAGDLRRLGMGGVKQPPFPTEDSKLTAFKELRDTQKIGNPPKLTKPGYLNNPPKFPSLPSTT